MSPRAEPGRDPVDTRATIVGVGQRLAGDDGVGPAIIDHLREWLRNGPRPDGLFDGITVAEVREPSALLPLLAALACGPLIVVDAVLAAPAGEVLELDVDELSARGLVSVSSHGLSVGQAIALGRAVGEGGRARPVRIVAVTIARPAPGASGLSPPVAAAVPRAAARALALAAPAASTAREVV